MSNANLRLLAGPVLGGLAVLLVDVAVISASGLNQAEALALAVIIG